jgi:hypothetical protein
MSLQVEEHFQQQDYGMTFDDRLGAALGQREGATEREAKRLAFYIFWNVKHEFSRRAHLPDHPDAAGKPI